VNKVPILHNISTDLPAEDSKLIKIIEKPKSVLQKTHTLGCKSVLHSNHAVKEFLILDLVVTQPNTTFFRKYKTINCLIWWTRVLLMTYQLSRGLSFSFLLIKDVLKQTIHGIT